MFKLMFGFVSGIIFAVAVILLGCIGITLAEETTKNPAPKPAADPFNLT